MAPRAVGSDYFICHTFTLVTTIEISLFSLAIFVILSESLFTNVKSISRWASKFMSSKICKECNGSRLNKQSSHFKIAGSTIFDVVNLDIQNLKNWLLSLETNLNKNHKIISTQIIKELLTRVQFILDVGLSYLTLNRTSKTLSGGEAQRIRLATQIGTQLTNVLYLSLIHI